MALLSHLHIWLDRMQVTTCHHLERLDISQCVKLTDAGIAALSTAPAVSSGRCAAEANSVSLLALICRNFVDKWLVDNDPESPTSAFSLAVPAEYVSAVCLTGNEHSSCPVSCPVLLASGSLQQSPDAMPHAHIACSVDTLTEGKHLLCRLWDLNISAMGTHFTGATLSVFLTAWIIAKLQGTGTAPACLRQSCG